MMFVKGETQKQKDARHNSDNYMPEFLNANGKAEEIARKAGYTPEKKIDSNGKIKTAGIIQQMADDLCSSGDLTEEEAKMLKKGKLERNKYIAHGKGNSTQSVSRENYNKFKDVVNNVNDFMENGSITYF